MKIFYSVICIFSATVGLAQEDGNLVPNGGFEEYSDCPTGPYQMNVVDYWEKPAGGTPDYFNTCGVWEPSHLFLKDGAFEGSGYVAFGSGRHLNDGSESYREYIQVRLKSKLKKKERYQVKLKYALSKNCMFAIDGIQVLFSTSLIEGTRFPDLIDKQPQLYDENKKPLVSEEWSTLTYNFKADSSYEYLIIGNFYSNDENSKLKLHEFVEYYPDTTYYTPNVYYFIDNVTIRSLTEAHYIPNAITPNGDKYNGLFKVEFNGPVHEFKLQVFDRWGQEIFQTIDTQIGWGGTYDGKDMPQGVYVYKVSYVDRYDITQYEVGRVTLIR